LQLDLVRKIWILDTLNFRSLSFHSSKLLSNHRPVVHCLHRLLDLASMLLFVWYHCHCLILQSKYYVCFRNPNLAKFETFVFCQVCPIASTFVPSKYSDINTKKLKKQKNEKPLLWKNDILKDKFANDLSATLVAAELGVWFDELGDPSGRPFCVTDDLSATFVAAEGGAT